MGTTPFAQPVGPLGLRTICDDPNDGHRNAFVTLAYRDLSRLTAAYTHGITWDAQAAPVGARSMLATPEDRAARATSIFASAHRNGESFVQTAIDGHGTAARVDVRRTPRGALNPAGPPGLIAEMAELDRAPAAARAAPRGRALPLNANFCTYAMWSSLTLGPDIRNARLPLRLDGLSSRRLRETASRLVVEARRTNDDELARLLGIGQRAVLWEVGTGIYSMLLEEAALNELSAVRSVAFEDYKGSATFTDSATAVLTKTIDRWLTQTINPRSADGLTQLRSKDLAQGLASYHLARRAAQQGAEAGEPDRHRRWVAELILRGNLLIGAYEQRRVDQVLRFPVQDFAAEFFLERSGVEAMERSGQGRWRGRADRLVRSGLSHTRPWWSRFFTDQVLVLRAGDELLRLGRDLPIPPGQATFLPTDLQHVQDRWLQMLLYRYDHSYGNGHGTQSRIWAVFDDRMNFIVNFMRSRAQTAGLWQEPFDHQSMQRLRRGQHTTSRCHR
jgi:hypothetical protein